MGDTLRPKASLPPRVSGGERTTCGERFQCATVPQQTAKALPEIHAAEAVARATGCAALDTTGDGFTDINGFLRGNSRIASEDESKVSMRSVRSTGSLRTAPRLPHDLYVFREWPVAPRVRLDVHRSGLFIHVLQPSGCTLLHGRKCAALSASCRAADAVHGLCVLSPGDLSSARHTVYRCGTISGIAAEDECLLPRNMRLELTGETQAVLSERQTQPVVVLFATGSTA